MGIFHQGHFIILSLVKIVHSALLVKSATLAPVLPRTIWATGAAAPAAPVAPAPLFYTAY